MEADSFLYRFSGREHIGIRSRCPSQSAGSAERPDWNATARATALEAALHN